MTPLVAVLAVLAVYRLTLLVVADEITRPPRDWLIERVPDRVGVLLSCPWCMSVWISVPVAWVAYEHGGSGWFLVPALALSASAVAGFLAEFAAP